MTTYADRTLQLLARKADAQCILLWEMRGPKDTAIAWISCYLLGKEIALVETFQDGGWNVFTPSGSNRVDDSIADAFNRCGVPVPARKAPVPNRKPDDGSQDGGDWMNGD